MTPKWKEERDSSEAKHCTFLTSCWFFRLSDVFHKKKFLIAFHFSISAKISPVSKRDIPIIYEFYPPGGAPLDSQKAIQSVCQLQMASRLRGLFKFPQLTKETKESNPSNNEKQVRHSAFVKNHRDQSEVSWYTLGLKSNISIHIYLLKFI